METRDFPTAVIASLSSGVLLCNFPTCTKRRNISWGILFGRTILPTKDYGEICSKRSPHNSLGCRWSCLILRQKTISID